MDKFAAVDLGAESGRVNGGDVGGVEVVHRFPNRPVRIGESLFWDILNLFTEIKIGLAEAFRRFRGEIHRIGLDTWGVDYALLDEAGDLRADRHPVHADQHPLPAIRACSPQARGDP